MIGFGFGAGARAAGGGGSYDPAVLALTGWWRASYTGPSWSGTASASTSGGRSLSAGTSPAVGGALNGLTPADFDGATHSLVAATIVSNWFSASAWSIVALFNADAAAAYGADEYDNPSIVSTTGAAAAAIGLAFSANGVSVWHTSGGAWPGVTVPCSTGGWHLAQAKYDGANIKLRVDSGGYSQQAAGNIDAGLAETLQVGVSWDGGLRFDGKVAELMFAQSALSDDTFDDIKGYINARYALAL